MNWKAFTGMRGLVLLLVFFFVGACCLLGVAASRGASPKLITSDGNACYSWLPTLLVDHDLDFKNNLQALYAPDSAEGQYMPTPRGTAATKCPIGISVVELPGFLAGHLAARAAGAPADGVSMPYQVSVALWLLLLTCAGHAALYAALVSRGVRASLALFFVAMQLLGTNLIHYAAKEPAMPHAVDVALAGVVAWLICRPNAAGLLSGFGVGLLAVCRNATLALAPWFAALSGRSSRSPGRRTGIQLAFLLPVLANAALFRLTYGHWVFRTYGGESSTGGAQGLVGCLVSTRHGLFLFHPWYLVLLVLAALGAWRLRGQRTICLAALFSFVLLWIFNGTWWCWWFGASFGNRAFVEALPALTFCGALYAEARVPAWSSRARIGMLVGAGAAVAWNFYLWGGYLLGRYPADGSHTLARLLFWAI
jgi:hypothetical protein